MPKGSVTVLLITMDELPNLKKVLANLSRQTVPVEIVVCDNASSDGTKEFIADKGIKYVRNERNIGTPVFNLGLPLATGDYVFIGATDMEFEPDCMKRLARHLDEHEDCGMAVPVNVNGNDRARIDIGGSWLSRGFYGGAVHTWPQGTVNMPFSGVGLVRRSALEKAGGFLYEPSFFIYAEDVDLGLRLLRAGYLTEMLSDAVLYHLGYQARKIFTPGQLTTRIERNMLVTMISHLPAGRLAAYFPYAVLLRIAVIAKDLVKRDWQRARARAGVLAGLFDVLRDGLARRRKLAGFLGSPSRTPFFGGFFSESPLKRIFLSYV